MKKIITSLIVLGTLATAGGFAQIGAAYSKRMIVIMGQLL